MTTRTKIFLTMAVLFALGCGGGADGDNAGDKNAGENTDDSVSGPSTGSVNVIWGDETVVLGDDAASKIVSFDRETGDLVFSSGTTGVENLQDGEIVIVPVQSVVFGPHSRASPHPVIVVRSPSASVKMGTARIGFSLACGICEFRPDVHVFARR